MTEIIQRLWTVEIHLMQIIEKLFNPFLKNLNPSLFQNIILSVLAIFIPFAIVFLTDILNSKNKDKKSEFEKMVLNDEVFGTKKIFWLSIMGIVFFAFFDGKEISNCAKIISIFVMFILIILFSLSFKKILRFSEGYRPEFEIPFLKNIKFSRIFWYKNKETSEKMLRAWISFWSEKSETNESDFTKVFISHITNAINFKNFDIAIQLSKTYVTNIEKRNTFLIGYEILPKVLEWNEILWNERQLWLKSHNAKKEFPSYISQKYFPTFRTWILKIYEKANANTSYFWNWNYFCGEFFQTITETLLKDGHSHYEFFESFKKTIEESNKKLDRIESEKEKEKENYWHYITELFANFCPIFFNKIGSAPSNYEIWEQEFPTEWKVSIVNKDNRISHIILNEFIRWSKDRIFEKDCKKNIHKDLTNVINGIFPNVHSSLFTAFLMMFFSGEIKYALEKEPNFYILGTSVWWSSSTKESEKDIDRKVTKMIKEKKKSQINETIQIILKYFHSWQNLNFYKDDLNKDETKNWDNYTKEQKKSVLKRVRKKKLEKIKTEIESNQIKEACKDSESKELYRKIFLKLIKLLIIEIKK